MRSASALGLGKAAPGASYRAGPCTWSTPSRTFRVYIGTNGRGLQYGDPS
ncbi:hypothetical protein QF032_000263 [Streptomyces achromogenes]|nr:hypothetical protein [Streptomyces achromogenes]MDQ0828419.1 hypothetical protein [Streptomyces achromogenes]